MLQHRVGAVVALLAQDRDGRSATIEARQEVLVSGARTLDLSTGRGLRAGRASVRMSPALGWLR